MSIVRHTYPEAVILLREGDTIIVKTRKGERKIPPNKWWLNCNTPVGEDAELWERKPYNGNRYIRWRDVISVESPVVEPLKKLIEERVK